MTQTELTLAIFNGVMAVKLTWLFCEVVGQMFAAVVWRWIKGSPHWF